MAEYDFQERYNELPARADSVLDPITEELKIELARLEQESCPVFGVQKELLIQSSAVQRAKEALERVESSCEDATLYRHAVGLLEALSKAFAAFDANEVFSRQRAFLAELIADLREQRRKARALMVRAMRAVFNIPLFLDGPELSGYRHRLR